MNTEEKPMNTKFDPKAPADLRWPTFGEGFMAGLFLLAAMTILIGLLHYFYPAANRNPWLVTIPDGVGPFQKSITSIFTTHFFHGSWEHVGGNLVGLWIIGLLAFSVAGAPRALAAMGYGILFAGIAQLVVGTEGVAHLGSSSIVFAFIGVLIPTAIRKGAVWTLLMVVGMSLIGDSFFETIRPTETVKVMGISWLAHLGGLIGGILADLKCPIEAVRVLHEKGVINPKETEKLLRRTSKGEYENEFIATMEEMKKAEEEKAETDSRKEAVKNA